MDSNRGLILSTKFNATNCLLTRAKKENNSFLLVGTKPAAVSITVTSCRCTTTASNSKKMRR